MFEAALSSSSTVQLANRPVFEKASVSAYAASAKQSIAKIILAVQSFLLVSSWRKSAGDECPQTRCFASRPCSLWRRNQRLKENRKPAVQNAVMGEQSLEPGWLPRRQVSEGFSWH